MLELLNTFKQGSSYDGALEKVYGFDTGGLDALWRDYVTEQEETHPAPVGILSVLVTAPLLALGLAVEGWAWRRGW